MSSTPESLTAIREALQGHEHLQDVDWNDADEVWEIVAGDSEGGEGVEYTQANVEGHISFTKTWGIWVLTEEHTTGERHPNPKYGTVWHHTWTVHPGRTTAKAAYIAALNAKQAEGVTWQPDICPIFDKIETTWK